jgi:hypothetical protein
MALEKKMHEVRIKQDKMLKELPMFFKYILLNNF